MSDATILPIRQRLDTAWVACGVVILLVAIFATPDLGFILSKALQSFLGTLPFIAFAVLAIAYLKASDAEHLIARAFKGSQTRMIILAALAGGLSPFCSCEVIPFIAAMLTLGVPLSAVMAFWLSSPLMDPAMFSITASQLGFEFATAKLIAAIGLGLFGGFAVRAMMHTGYFDDPLKPRTTNGGGCCGPSQPFSGDAVWKFWQHADRRSTFRTEAVDNGLFLLKWLMLAYLLEAVMIRYVPAELVGQYLGGDGFLPILLGALIGGPAYLNGYAAVPLVAGLMEQGMNPGAAMSFMLAGGVSCIPAATAVFALVKTRVFGAYLAIAFAGSLVAGSLWAIVT